MRLNVNDCGMLRVVEADCGLLRVVAGQFCDRRHVIIRGQDPLGLVSLLIRDTRC